MNCVLGLMLLVGFLTTISYLDADVAPGGVIATKRSKHKPFNKAKATNIQQTTIPNNKSLLLTSLLAGGTARACAQMILYPIDALRTLAQTRDGKTLADVGFKTIVRGATTTSSFALCMGALQFSIFSVSRPYVGPVFASALGAAGSCLVSVPQEVIKQRLVTGIYNNFNDACISIFRTDGVKGFYSAWRPTMARNIPFVITTFTTMDFLKEKITKNRDNKELTALENVAAGMGSALLAGIITNPIDVVKTRMMTQASSSAVPYTSALDCVNNILKSESLSTFYSGFAQRSIYMMGLWGVTFALNGKIKDTLGKYIN